MAALDGTVEIAGKTFQKKSVAVGLAATGAVAFVVVMHRRQAAQDAQNAATAAGDQTADLGTDPATGYPYGSAEDEQALSDWQSLGGSGGGFTGGGGGTTGGGVPGGFTSNAEWTQFCEQAMGSTGSDAIAAALGHYVTGQTVTPDQRTVIEEAIAIGNYPPVPGANGYPPGIKDGTPASGSGGGGGTPNPNRKKKQVTADGTMTLREIASRFSSHTSYAEARALNPWAHRFTVKSRNIPKGYKVTLYA